MSCRCLAVVRALIAALVVESVVSKSSRTPAKNVQEKTATRADVGHEREKWDRPRRSGFEFPSPTRQAPTSVQVRNPPAARSPSELKSSGRHANERSHLPRWDNHQGENPKEQSPCQHRDGVTV
jgi:hypothetical protein